jgi:hypothetical protein
MRRIDTGVEHCVDEALVTRPSQAVTGAVEIDLEPGVDSGVA